MKVNKLYAEDGSVVNYKYCENRAAQYIRRYFDRNYEIVPPIEPWEYDLLVRRTLERLDQNTSTTGGRKK